MTKKSRLFGQFILAAASVLCLIAPKASAGDPAFDGSWFVRIVADSGTCQPRTIPILVSSGKISFSVFGATASGAIGANGAVDFSIAHNEQVVKASGSAKGATAAGNWHSSTASCDGTWTAQRS